jgi:hypothetical protein
MWQAQPWQNVLFVQGPPPTSPPVLPGLLAGFAAQAGHTSAMPMSVAPGNALVS